MGEFAVRVLTDVEQVSDEQLDALVDELRHVHAAVSMLDGALSAQMTVEAADMWAAGLAGQAALVSAMDRAGVADSRDERVAGVEVLTAAVFEGRVTGAAARRAGGIS